MTGRLTTTISTALTTSAFLLALAGAACSSGGRGPSGGGDTGGAGGEEEPTGGKTGGHVSPDAASGGKGTGGSDDTGGATGTGGSTSTGGSTGSGGSTSTGGSSGTGGSTGKPDAGADSGAAAPTFTEVYTRIMSMMPEVTVSSCWGPCHAGPGTAKAMQKIDMTTKEKAYPGVMKLVVAGNPARSTLYNEINQGKMPEKKPKLPAALIKLVADWITAGAKNN
jgi:hypothetical protein